MLSDLLHVAVLCSKRAPGLDALLRHPGHGRVFQVECIVTTEVALDETRVPVVSHPIRSFYDTFDAPITNRGVRTHYDAATAHLLTRLGIDAVLLLGYLYVITDPILDLWSGRIFNVHDSDLPKYPGLHATRNAVAAGEAETRSSVHLVTRELDGGPVIARSEVFPVAPFAREAAQAGHTDIVRAYAYAQREWMMRRTWGDLAATALEQVIAEAVA
jgi:phosphoribosylglycinamide formyltransferase-1